MPLHFLFTLCICLALGTASLAAEPVFPPGSRAGLVPPSGMTASASFQGFEDRSNRAVLLISEVSAQTYDKIAQDFSPEAIRGSGMEEISRETLQLTPGEGLLVVTRQGGKGNVVMLSEEEFAGWQETVHLLSNPRNAARLLESIQQADAGLAAKHDLIEP